MTPNFRRQITLHDFSTPAFSASVVDKRPGGERQAGTDGPNTSRELRPARSTIPAAAPSAQGSNATPRTILVADDDAAVRDSLARALTTANYQVVPVSNGWRALECFRHEPIDLVLLDLSMPHQDGWQTFERMMACDPRVPVIIITGHDNQYARACSAGASALLEKPIDIPALLEVIQQLLEESNRRKPRSGFGPPPKCRYHEPDRAQFMAHQNARWRFMSETYDLPLTGGINE